MGKMKRQLKEIKIKNFLFLTIAGIINAFGVTVFIAPVMLYDSGISGTSILLSQLTPEQFSLSFFLVVLNVPLFLFGLKKQGVAFTLYAVFTVLIYSLSAWIIVDILPIDVSMASPLAGTDLLLCAIFGGMISGLGSGLAVRFGGAMDGVEVLAVIFAKKLGITVGTFVMVYNLLLYIVCGIILGSWILPLYSIVTYGAGLKTIDFVIEGIDRSKGATIITSNPEAVCKALSDEFECGITIYKGMAYYSQEERDIIYIIVNRFQITRMRDIVHQKDDSAFISICEVADIFPAKDHRESVV